jgi:iron complex outermembrane recepter protein
VNFSAGINFERFSVSAFLNNAFDERAELNRNAATYDERITTNRPRTIGIRLGARF